MTEFTPDPIKVTESAMPAQLMSLVRDALLAATAWAVGKGYIDQATGTQLGIIGMGLATVARRQFVTHMAHKKTVMLAAAVPNSIAVVR